MTGPMARLMKYTAAVMSLMFASGSIDAKPATGPETAFDFEFTSIDGSPLPLSAYRGKALLVVNTASFCGFTGQYQGLQDLWSRYEAQGLVVIGVPANDFYQEPKGEKDIKSFCQGSYGVTFPLTSKVTVTGEDAHPFYRWAAAAAGPPSWNFYKYLIGRNGQVMHAFNSTQTPTGSEIIGWVEKALAEKVSSAPAMAE